MKAVVFEQFSAPPNIQQLPDPTPEAHGVVVKVMANGVCRSDWHGWVGHDTDIQLPHVPGHELAGVVEAVGKDVKQWRVGDRVTVPFVAGCGTCPECHSGNHQVCDSQFQPGFTHWGSVCRVRGYPLRRRQFSRPAGNTRFRHCGQPGLPLRYFL